ncbi:MAG: DUF3800 domain-containing protein [Bdellovibrionota bacterium]
MYLCYVDEAGCTGSLPSATSPVQPVFVLAAIAIKLEDVKPFTTDFLQLKHRFFPGTAQSSAHYLDGVLSEIKGAELRRDAASASRRHRTHALGFLDKTVDLLVRHDAKIFGRVWIKGVGAFFNGTSVYTYSMQTICAAFQRLLEQQGKNGLVIADSRAKRKNAKVSHSIFTQKFQAGGDPLHRIVEMPTFGHSDNHAGIQAADLLCSAFLFPMSAHAYCTDHVRNLHVRPGYALLRQRYGTALQNLQFRYQEPTTGRWRGGITVSDAIQGRPGGLLFR